MMNVNEIIKIAVEAGQITLGADRNKKVYTKEGRANFVTEYDTRVQRFIVDSIKKLVPDA